MAEHTEVKLSAGNPSGQAGPYVLRCECGEWITTAIPCAKDARYICSCCNSSRKKKNHLKRIRDDAKNTALKQRLETFSSRPLEGHQSEWFELALDLKVDAVALEAVVAVVQEGRWRESTAPLMFVRVNVERRSKEWQDPFGEDGRLRHEQIFSPVPTREDRENLKIWTYIRDFHARVTPEDIEAASPTLSLVEDEAERGVLCARALGLTRAQYLSGVSDTERRRRAAAWKRLHRHGLPNDLRQALRRASDHGMIEREELEDRAWEESQDRHWYELRSKPTPSRGYGEDDDRRTRRVVQNASR